MSLRKRTRPNPRELPPEVHDHMMRVSFTDTSARVEWDIPREFDRPIRTVTVEVGGTQWQSLIPKISAFVQELEDLTYDYAVSVVNVEPQQVFLLPEEEAQ